MIWAYAKQTGATIVTKDSDFAGMRRRFEGPQVLWLRIGNAAAADVIAHLESRWPGVLEYLQNGEAIVEC